MSGKRKRWLVSGGRLALCAVLWIGAFATGAEGRAASVYQSITGSVLSASPDDIVLRRDDGQEVSLHRAERMSEPSSGVRPGERVTVWYSLQAEIVQKQGPGQLPGKAAPGQKGEAPRPRTSPPRERKREPVIDDRAFYSAKEDSVLPFR